MLRSICSFADLGSVISTEDEVRGMGAPASPRPAQYVNKAVTKRKLAPAVLPHKYLVLLSLQTVKGVSVRFGSDMRAERFGSHFF
jgi:hypothetical protein